MSNPKKIFWDKVSQKVEPAFKPDKKSKNGLEVIWDTHHGKMRVALERDGQPVSHAVLFRNKIWVAYIHSYAFDMIQDYYKKRGEPEIFEIINDTDNIKFSVVNAGKNDVVMGYYYDHDFHTGPKSNNMVF